MKNDHRDTVQPATTHVCTNMPGEGRDNICLPLYVAFCVILGLCSASWTCVLCVSVDRLIVCTGTVKFKYPSGSPEINENW